MSFLGSMIRRCFKHLEKIPAVRSQCYAIVNRDRNENNDDPSSNGEYHFLRSTARACSVVFDVGANVGEWTRAALEINPRLEIHCFEPSADTFRALSRANFPSNVHLNNLGLSSCSHEQKLHLFGPEGGMNSIYRRQGLEAGFGIQSPTETEEIQMVTLDDYCARWEIEHIDLLKIDVEGHDLEVLRGARRMLAGKVAKIQFEYGGANIDARTLLLDFFELLEPFGFDIYKIEPQGLQPIPCYDARLENFQYKNFVAIARVKKGE